MNSMNRLNFLKNFKAYTLRMKDRRKQNMALLRAYFKKQRMAIVQNTQRRMIRGTLWVGFLSATYYIIHKIYSQKLQVQRMQKKILKTYPSVTTKISTQKKDQVYYVVPQYEDQLANIIEMCWKLHFKVIVNSDSTSAQHLNQHANKILIDIPQQVKGKCVIINLKNLKSVQIDEINGLMKVENGISCRQLNQILEKSGYQRIFPFQIQESSNQTVYNAVANNYPSNEGALSNLIANLDIISSQGQYFRSSNENNQYGSTPNLNNIFLGTGGIFGLPLRTTFKITKKKTDLKQIRTFQLQSNDLNQKLLMIRKLRQNIKKSENLLKYKIFNNSSDKEQLKIKIFSNKLVNGIVSSICSQIQKQLPDLKQIQAKQQPQDIKTSDKKNSFNIYFNSNQVAFQKFVLFRQKLLKQNKTNPNESIPYSYQNNLLKLCCQNEALLTQIISQLCSQNSVVVWCKNHEFLKQIKKMTDQNEVGSQLMKILVQIRQGIDHKKVYYTHNRYEEYFAKGTFRKLTQVFW